MLFPVDRAGPKSTVPGVGAPRLTLRQTIRLFSRFLRNVGRFSSSQIAGEHLSLFNHKGTLHMTEALDCSCRCP